MAPLRPLGRARVIALVEEGELPIWLGSPHPSAMIVEQERGSRGWLSSWFGARSAGNSPTVFRIRGLKIDRAEAAAAREASLAAGGFWMPEQYYELGRPVGRIHLEAATRDELVAKMRTMEWPKHW